MTWTLSSINNFIVFHGTRWEELSQATLSIFFFFLITSASEVPKQYWKAVSIKFNSVLVNSCFGFINQALPLLLYSILGFSVKRHGGATGIVLYTQKQLSSLNT